MGSDAPRTSTANTLAALKSIRTARLDGAPICDSDHPRHTVRTRAPHAYLRWRNANARRRDVLAAQRKERALVRSEKGIRWSGRPLEAVA
ncbi:hypothetical protein [Streptomyces pharetrae]|uniref:hypothetical protein n=1 Tax=Streptomyces pharetrae TaxID=291370 RepID=UPI003D9E8247